MSQWHRDNPELMGAYADPWMQHETYRKALQTDPIRLNSEREADDDPRDAPDPR